ncbi:HAMP domain-containing histidine kinase [Mucilaginibacter sp. RS28]|uniref:histidine kinase n=1 Tax=Mucilaginibacter straminoryzae TaxID=2932774 RepID=A0A9X2BBB3_9SPHI|nr:HAMP domain-containing sensor histidine kinase [Mucilaginibacter straminoryzae]MCJ8211620.1 HAMP domain-containing histidine kinase [Mucilaginibacter straminoryzae]
MKQQQGYQKNFSLIVAFFVLISVSLIVALIITYNFTDKYVENEFASKKIDVLEQTLKPYEDLYLNKVYEITNFQGFLDSASAAKYSASVFSSYPFVKRTVFYDVRIGSHDAQGRSPGISLSAVYDYSLKNKKVTGRRRPVIEDADFRQMAEKFSNYLVDADTSRIPDQSEVFKTFYDIKPNKITYLNIPRREEIKAYRQLKPNSASYYKQNMMTFQLDPYALRVANTHPELYQRISIQPVVYDPLDDESKELIAEIPFPGAFSDYKLYFRSSNNYLQTEIYRRFVPTAAIVLLIYTFLMVIGWLIYRNLSINLKIFKLQYDFINNFTHEFKTPVSVIKIAGSNLRSESELTERQRKHYGRILDEEADKLNDLMNKLLSFTQIENRSIKLKKKEINVPEFVNSYIETFRIKYPDFKLQYQIDHAVTFFADPVLLGSIFQNLMENAYKYSHPQSKELMIRVTHEKRNIVFTFSDKGIGIPKGEVRNIFKKFYRIENKYNQNGSVGLGLAFCKELAIFMNGDITVESEVNKGSVFTVTLPYES